MSGPARASVRTATVVLAVLLIPSLAACGTKRVPPPQSTSTASTPAGGSPTATTAVIPPSPSANDYVTAIVLTQSAGSARVVVDLLTDVAGTGRELTGTGTAILDPGWADMTWTGDGGVTRELVNDQGIFVQSDPPDGRWMRIPSSLDEPRSTPTSGSADPLRELETLQDVVEQGPEVLGTVDATRYTGSLPVDAADLSAMGLTDEEITAIGPVPADARIDVTLWLDATRRVIRVDRLLDLGPDSPADISAFATVTLRDFGALVDLTSPPSGSVDAAPEGQ